MVYETEQPALVLSRTPFVGRDSELARIKGKLADARTGRGGLVMLVGEPGIGKSRMIEEFTEHARSDGAAVLFGACFEGEWVPPFAPFAEAIDDYAKERRRRDAAGRPRPRRRRDRAPRALAA